MQEGTIDAFVQDVGEFFDDFTISRSADGTLRRNRVVRAVNEAQRKVFTFLRPRVHKNQLPRKITLTEDSENNNVYLLPSRVIGIGSVEDSNGVYYSGLMSRHRHYEVGYIVERRASTQAPNNRPVIRFVNVEPTATISAWALEHPVPLTGGDGTYTSTTAVLEATPDLGNTMVEDDYYIGSQIMIVQSGAATQGAVGTATDYVGSTRTLTVPTWSTTPTAQDDYSLVCDLPRACWRLVVLEAARQVMRRDKRYEDVRKDIMDELAEESRDVVLGMRRPAEGIDRMPREAEIWVW